MTTKAPKTSKKLKKVKRVYNRAVRIVRFTDELLSGAFSESIAGHSFLVDPLSGSLLS